MQRSIVIVLLFLSFGLKAQVYQAMPQAGYGPVKRFLTDSVLTIPTGINSLRNITGGRDAGQIRWNTTDSGFYVYSGTQWIKINIDSVSLSNRINGKLNISDTATMLSVYLRKGDTLSLSNRINLRVKYSDTAAMLLPYLRKLDTASLSDRINKKMDSLILTTIGTGGLATLLGTTLNIPNYGGALTGYVPYSGATNNVTLGSYNLTGTLLNADYSLQIKNEVGAGGASTLGYTSISSNNSGYYFYTSYTGGQKGAYFNYPTSGTTFSYNLPVRAGTIALVEDTVSLSNRINAKIGASDTVSLSNRINLKVNISDTASMLLPYLRKADTSSLSNRIDLKLNASDTASLSNRINLKLNISDTASMLSSYQSAINARVKYSDTAAMLDPYLTAAVTSVGLSMPVAFSVANSPITSTGTIAVSAIGTAAQYIRGDGQLATLPSGSSGGSSVDYYLNGGTSQGTIGGSTYYEMSKDAVIGTNADFNRTNAQGNGLIAQFITDAGDPNRIEIPAGAWNFEMFFSASSSGGSPSYYIELLKYDGTTFTSIATGSANPELITSGTVIDLYLSSLAVPYTTLAITDRLVVRVYVVTSGKTITLHTQDGHLCLITTTFAGGVSSLNGLTANTQYLAVGTSGTDFAINSLTDTHTFNLPTASATNRGALSSADWTTFNGKMNFADTVSLSNRINTKLNSADTASLSNRINTKADALSGTTNTVPKFTSSTTIGNSNIKDDGNAVSINTTAGANGALQVGSYSGNILLNTDNSSGGLIFKNTSSSNKLWDFSSYNNDLNFNESGVATPVITLQAGGNVGIKTITPAYQLEVNGTFKSGGIATFSSTLSNGTYAYTLPSATGTIALTSQLTSGTVTSIATGLGLSGGTITTSGTLLVDTSSASILSRQRAANTYATTSALSGYLPLTGGTLTGALGGTSATFTNSVTTTSVLYTNNNSSGAQHYQDFGNGGGFVAGRILRGNGASGYVPNGLNILSYDAFQISANATGGSGGTINLMGGSVGIGVNTPLAKLVVATASNVNLEVRNGADYGLTGVAIDSRDDTRSTRNALLLYGSPVVIGGGNVLINTTTDAGYKLDVNGTGRFSGQIFSDVTTGTNQLVLRTSGIDRGYIQASNATLILNSLTGNDIQFQANSNTKATITSAGNVGIGTTSPTQLLSVSAPAALMDVTSTTSTQFNGLEFKNGGGSFYVGQDNSTGTFYGGGNGYAGSLYVSGAYAFNIYTNATKRLTIASTGAASFSSSVSVKTTEAAEGLMILGRSDDFGVLRFKNAAGSANKATIYTNPNNLTFDVGSTANAMTITSGGDVGIGTTPASGVRLHVSGNLTVGSLSSGSDAIINLATNASGSPRSIAYRAATAKIEFTNTGGSAVASIDNGGAATFSSLGTGTVYSNGGTLTNTNPSDSSLKNSISPLSYGLSEILKLEPKTFYYNSDSTKASLKYGFIAQDVQPIMPDLVRTISNGSDKLGLESDGIYVTMVNAIKELSAQIKELQTKIQTLENK